jgi:hypothetical protein
LPDVVYVCPLIAQTYESQAVTAAFDVAAFSVNCNVSVLTHPDAFNDVEVYAPLAV